MTQDLLKELVVTYKPMAQYTKENNFKNDNYTINTEF